eukprot:5815276-Lingulodinium_polyedra.AAC.1
MFFLVSPADAGASGLPQLGSLELEAEDDWAERAMRLVLQILRHRLKSAAWHQQGPGLLALFLQDDPQAQAKGLGSM